MSSGTPLPLSVEKRVHDRTEPNAHKHSGHRITAFQYFSKEASVGPVFHPGTTLQEFPVLSNWADHPAPAPSEVSDRFRSSAMLLHIHLNILKLPGEKTYTETHEHTGAQEEARV